MHELAWLGVGLLTGAVALLVRWWLRRPARRLARAARVIGADPELLAALRTATGPVGVDVTVVVQPWCRLTDEELYCRVAEVLRLFNEYHRAAGGAGVRLARPVEYRRPGEDEG